MNRSERASAAGSTAAVRRQQAGQFQRDLPRLKLLKLLITFVQPPENQIAINSALPRALLVGLALLATLATPEPYPAKASFDQITMFQDGRLTNPPEREQLLDELQSLGVGSLHVFVPWRALAPRPFSRRKPRGFKGTSPADYEVSKWDPYDDLLRSATARGLSVLLTPNGPAPLWAQQGGSREKATSFKPNVREFGRFVEAVGRRYSGSYQDENGDTLPRNNLWSLWNEPLEKGWLSPQYKFSRQLGKRIPYSPQMFRSLYRAGYAALRRSGHGHDRILLGELSPIGVDFWQTKDVLVAPGLFLRELFCLDAHYRPFRGLERKVRGCRNYRKIKATGVAYHPYIVDDAQNPWYAPKDRDDITIGSLGRLEKALDRAAARGRVTSKLPIYITELGAFTGGQADPEDLIGAIGLLVQAEAQNVSEYIAYTNPRVKSYAHYQIVDDPPNPRFSTDDPRRYDGWYTGLKASDYSLKPAYGAFRLPIHVVKTGSPDKVRVWGAVRPVNRGAPWVQILAGHGDDFSPAGSPVAITNPQGYFETTVQKKQAVSFEWAIGWTDNNGDTFYSRSAIPQDR